MWLSGPDGAHGLHVAIPAEREPGPDPEPASMELLVKHLALVQNKKPKLATMVNVQVS